jgi:ABC-type iron transport system FetAB permease component
MSSYIALSYWDLVFAAIFLILNGALSLALNLGLERQLLIAATRMIVQLLLVGLVLKAIFAAASLWLTVGVAILMGLFAGREIWARQERRLAGPWGYSIGAGAMMFAGVLVTLVALTTQIEPDPWWSPRFALPLFGMILGNTMTGVSLGLDTLNTTLFREKVAVEARLLLGQTRWRRLASRHDDRSDSFRRRSDRGRQIPAPHHVPDRRRHRSWRAGRRLWQRLAPDRPAPSPAPRSPARGKMTKKHFFAVKCGGGHKVAVIQAMFRVVCGIDTIGQLS